MARKEGLAPESVVGNGAHLAHPAHRDDGRQRAEQSRQQWNHRQAHATAEPRRWRLAFRWRL